MFFWKMAQKSTFLQYGHVIYRWKRILKQISDIDKSAPFTLIWAQKCCLYIYNFVSFLHSSFSN